MPHRASWPSSALPWLRSPCSVSAVSAAKVPGPVLKLEAARRECCKSLYETTARSDMSLRKVILGGTPGHRTVKVPAWHGIDPEL